LGERLLEFHWDRQPDPTSKHGSGTESFEARDFTDPLTEVLLNGARAFLAQVALPARA